MTPAADSARLFISREEAAEILGVSLGGLNLSMARGELDNTFVRLGRSVRFGRSALEILAAGLSDPAALGRFCAGAGIDGFPSLLDWLAGPGDGGDDG